MSRDNRNAFANQTLHIAAYALSSYRGGLPANLYPHVKSDLKLLQCRNDAACVAAAIRKRSADDLESAFERSGRQDHLQWP